jgi:hypothetical protein
VRFLSHPRYLYPVVLLPAYAFCVALASAIRGSDRPDRWADTVHACVVVMLVVASIAGAQAYAAGIGTVYTHLPQQAVYTDIAPWLAAHTSSDARVGAFNGGLLSHYSQRDIVDLDGVMNDRVIAPLREVRLCDYIDREHLDYLADMALAIDDFSIATHRACAPAGAHSGSSWSVCRGRLGPTGSTTWC